MDLAKIIKKVPLFQGIDDATIEKLTTQCHQKFCTKGRDLFAMGDTANVFLLLCMVGLSYTVLPKMEKK